MFENLLRIVCGDRWFHTKHQEGEAVEPDVNKPKDSTTEDKYQHEIEVLKQKYGELEGLTIDITLRKMLDLIPRERRRSDAYKGLKSALKSRYHCQLNIVSGKQFQL